MRKQAKDLRVGDECYLVSPYGKAKILKVMEVLRTIKGNAYKVKFDNGSFCTMHHSVSIVQWDSIAHSELYLEKEPALYQLENYAHLISESIKEIRNELI